MGTTPEKPTPDSRTSSSDVTAFLKSAFVRRLAVLLPLVVTFLILSLVWGFIVGFVSPIVLALVDSPLFESRLLVTFLTFAIFAAVVVTVGISAGHGRADGRLESQFDAFKTPIPGIGSIYRSVDEVSEILLDSETDSFQEVKLVEYPTDGSYSVAFKTVETSDQVTAAVCTEGMETLFMPIAPNPVMGGFVIHVEPDRVIDIGLTVEKGIRTIVTSCVAVSENDPIESLDDGQFERIERGEHSLDSTVRRTGSGSVVDDVQLEDGDTETGRHSRR